MKYTAKALTLALLLGSLTGLSGCRAVVEIDKPEPVKKSPPVTGCVECEVICPPAWHCDSSAPESLNVIPQQPCPPDSISMLGFCAELPPEHSEPQGVWKI